MKNENKYEKRNKTWPKTIRIRKSAYEYIEKQRQELEFSTLAGTLDLIINTYKKDNK